MKAIGLNTWFAWRSDEPRPVQWQHHPVWAFLLACCLAFGLYLLLAQLLGLPIVDWDERLRFPVSPQAWSALMFSVLLGYGLVVTPSVLARNAADIVLLADVAPKHTAHDLQNVYWCAYYANKSRALRWGLTGGFLGAVPAVLSLITLRGQTEYLGFYWFLLASPIIYFQLALYAHASTSALREAMGAVTRCLQIDLLDLSKLRPFNRIALRNAVSWIIPANIFVLLFLNIPIAELQTIWWPLLANAAIGFAATLIPLIEIHVKLRDSKEEMLLTINTELQSMTKDGCLLDVGARKQARASYLLTLRESINRVREWPMDTSSFGKLAFYLAIVLGGWIGGALVERAFDLVW